MSEKDLVQRFRAGKKMELVLECEKLQGVDLGRFLRENGISSPEIRAWREQMHEGLESGRLLDRKEKNKYLDEIAALKEENRKLKVLTELQKKLQIGLDEIEADENKAIELKNASSKSSKKGLKKG